MRIHADHARKPAERAVPVALSSPEIALSVRAWLGELEGAGICDWSLQHHYQKRTGCGDNATQLRLIVLQLGCINVLVKGDEP
jgi:hypothetical protein